MEPYKVPAAKGVRGRGHFSQNAGRGKTSSNPFLGSGRDQAWHQQIPRASTTKPSRITNRGKSKHYC